MSATSMRASRFVAVRRSLLVAVVALVTMLQALGAQAPPAGYVALTSTSRGNGLDAPVTIARTASLRQVIADIVAQAHVSVAFDNALPALDSTITFRAQGLAAAAALARLLDGTSLAALVSPAGAVVLVPRTVRRPEGVRFRASVRDAETGAAIGGAQVALVGTRFTGSSRDSGDVSLGDVPVGDYDIRVTRLGFTALTLPHVRIPDEVRSAPLLLSMQRATVKLSEVVVTPGFYGLLDGGLATPQSLSRQQLETMPQIGEDIYRAVSRLPGVSADDFSAKFSVRGGSGEELYVSLDGLELVEPFHLKDIGGAFSIVDIQSLGSASLTTGGFPVEYGDRLTGVFTLRTADPRTDRVHTSLGMSLMNARATAQGGFASGRGGWLVSARPGFLDLALKFTSVKDSIKPRYYDLFAKAQYDLGAGGRVAIHALRANDSFRYLQHNEPNITSSYGSSYGWLTWDDSFGSRLHMQSVLSGSLLDWRRHGEGFDRGVQTARIDDARSLHRVGVRQDWTFDASSRLLLKWGLDAKREHATYDYFSAIARGDAPGVGTPGVDTSAARANPTAMKTALYFAPRFQLFPSLTAEVGVRYDHNTFPQESIVSPRLNLSWTPLAGTTVRGAWGKYAQSEALFGLHAQDGDTTFARAERAEQRILGVEHAFPFGMSGRIEAYDKRRTHARADYTNASGDIRLFPELSWDRLRIDRTAGRDRGVELQLSRAGGEQVDWSVGYALASSVDTVGGRAVPRSFDQKHAVHLDWSFHPVSNAWRLSVGGVWHSGWPYTPTKFLVDTIVNGSKTLLNYNPTPGALNSERLPAYQRVDARFTRYVNTRSGRWSVFGEVYKHFDTVNIRGLTKNASVIGPRVSIRTVEVTQWPRLPIAGLTWEF